MLRPDVLRAAWDRVAANDGAPGVDGMTIRQVVESPHGISGFCAEIESALRSKAYRPQPDFGELSRADASCRSKR